MNMRMFFIVFCVCGLAACTSNSTPPGGGGTAPVVDNVDSGSGSAGDAVTVTGSGFGTKEIGPYHWDDFQAGTVGETISDGADTHWQIGNPPCGADYKPTYSEAEPRYAGDVGAHQWFGSTPSDCYVYNQDLLINPVPSTHIFFQGWFWTRAQGKASRNIKPWQFSNTDWTYPQTRFEGQPIAETGIYSIHDVDGDQSSPADETGWFGYSNFNWGGETWTSLEIVHDDGTANEEDGVFEAFLNGNKVVDFHGMMKTADDPARVQVHVFGFVGVCALNEYDLRTCGDDIDLYGEPYPDVDIYWSEIYLDTSWARIQIGDAAIYEACTHREIQIPTAWSEESVTFTLRPGSFVPGDTVYVFVVNEDGNASEGVPLVIE